MKKYIYILLVLLCACCKTPITIIAPKLPIVPYQVKQFDLDMIHFTNVARWQNGKTDTLKFNQHITDVADTQSVYMAKKRVVNHDHFQERSDDLVHYHNAQKVGENVAYNYLTAESTIVAWMNSPEHKANILGDFTQIGIATEVDILGRIYVTQIFTK